MARIYLSARFERQQELRAVRNALIGYGHEVPCRWLEEQADVTTNRERAYAAEKCLEDICNSDIFVAFTEFTKRSERGGRFVEFGIARAWLARVIVCGPREENIFHHLAEVEQVDSVAGLLALLHGADAAAETVAEQAANIERRARALADKAERMRP